jgi:hypothetical protein
MWNNIVTDEGQLTNYILRQSLKSAKQSSFLPQKDELPFSSNPNIQNIFSQIENIDVIVSNLYNLPIRQINHNGVSYHQLSSKIDNGILKKTKPHIQLIVDSFNYSIDELIQNPIQIDYIILTKLYKKYSDLEAMRQLLNKFFFQNNNLRFIGNSFHYNKVCLKEQECCKKLLKLL